MWLIRNQVIWSASTNSQYNAVGFFVHQDVFRIFNFFHNQICFVFELRLKINQIENSTSFSVECWQCVRNACSQFLMKLLSAPIRSIWLAFTMQCIYNIQTTYPTTIHHLHLRKHCSKLCQRVSSCTYQQEEDAKFLNYIQATYTHLIKSLTFPHPAPAKAQNWSNNIATISSIFASKNVAINVVFVSPSSQDVLRSLLQ